MLPRRQSRGLQRSKMSSCVSRSAQETREKGRGTQESICF